LSACWILISVFCFQNFSIWLGQSTKLELGTDHGLSPVLPPNARARKFLVTALAFPASYAAL
jgi:hypothetical protein